LHVGFTKAYPLQPPGRANGILRVSTEAKVPLQQAMREQGIE